MFRPRRSHRSIAVALSCAASASVVAFGVMGTSCRSTSVAPSATAAVPATPTPARSNDAERTSTAGGDAFADAATSSAIHVAAASQSSPAPRAMHASRAPLPQDAGANYVPSAQPDRPRLRYLDGQVSLNDTCMIRLGNKLNPRMPPAYVNGAPLGFC